MSTTNWEKLDKFYIVLFLILSALGILVVYTVRGVFSAVINAYDVDQGAQNEVQVEKEKVDEAHEFIFGVDRIQTEQSN